MMLEQTQWTVKHLLLAGLRRNEFSVRTESRRRNGCTEYIGVRIVLRCDHERSNALSSKLAEHFTVTKLMDEQRVRYVSVEYGEPGLYEQFL